MKGILKRADRARDTDVLNGIAYDPGTNRIFVTGKRWSKLFEIQVVEQ
jgi:glutamine cyclotransferase